MNTKKVSIIGLIVIGILFAIGQGGGIFREDKDVDENDQAGQRKASQEQAGWTDPIRGGLAPLGLIDGIDVSRVTAKAAAIPPSPDTAAGNCIEEKSDDHYILKLGAGCELQADITGIDNDDKQSVELNVTGGCDQTRDFARLKRITSAIAVSPHIKVPAIGSGMQVGSTPDESSDTWPGLKIAYHPNGGNKVEMEEPWKCGDEPVTLIILRKGGTLTLECSECKGSRKLEVQIA
ncbi:MAG: hypothetical protein ABFS24_12365 [Pseudomonadota bacterium]